MFRLLLFLLVLPTVAFAVEPWPWTLEPIGDGAYAALQPARWRFQESNSIVLVTERGVVVIDTQTDGTAVRTLIDEIAKITDQPVRYVINTHWHMDHTLGNKLYREAFGPEVVFLAHASLMKDIPERMVPSVVERVGQVDEALPAYRGVLESGEKQDGSPLGEDERSLYQAAFDRAEIWLEDYRDADVVLPDLTYEDRLTLHFGEHEVQLLYRRGHTRGDTVVYLPRQKILASGDMVDDMPYAGHGYPAEWVASLRSLLELEFETVVPGHGPLFERDQMELQLEFFAWLVEQVEPFETLEAAQEGVDLAGWREKLSRGDEAGGRFYDAVMGEAVERAWREAQGELNAELGD